MEANRRIIQQRFKDSMELWNDTLRAIHKKWSHYEVAELWNQQPGDVKASRQ
jgi:hypothetical protein